MERDIFSRPISMNERSLSDGFSSDLYPLLMFCINQGLMFQNRKSSDHDFEHGYMHIAWEFADLIFNKPHELWIFLNQPIFVACEMFPPSFASIYMIDGINGITRDDR
jgi:hypothetical protein